MMRDVKVGAGTNRDVLIRPHRIDPHSCIKILIRLHPLPRPNWSAHAV